MNCKRQTPDRNSPESAPSTRLAPDILEKDIQKARLGQIDMSYLDKLAPEDRQMIWDSLTLSEKIHIGRPSSAVGFTLIEYLNDNPRPNSGVPEDDMTDRVEQMKPYLLEQSAKKVLAVAKNYVAMLRQAGLDEDNLRDIGLITVDVLGMMDHFSLGSIASDATIHRISADATLALELFQNNDPNNALPLQTKINIWSAVIFRDAACLTDAAQMGILKNPSSTYAHFSNEFFTYRILPVLKNAIPVSSLSRIKHGILSSSEHALTLNDNYLLSLQLARQLRFANLPAQPRLFRLFPILETAIRERRESGAPLDEPFILSLTTQFDEDYELTPSVANLLKKTVRDLVESAKDAPTFSTETQELTDITPRKKDQPIQIHLQGESATGLHEYVDCGQDDLRRLLNNANVTSGEQCVYVDPSTGEPAIIINLS